MLIFRLFLVLALITWVVLFSAYLLTGNKRYLQLSWRLFKFAIVLLAAGGLLFAISRILLL